MLGLCLAYLKDMHPAKLPQPDEAMRVSAHLINMNEPLVKVVLPNSNPTATINAALSHSNTTQVRTFATQWAAKG
jgi:hypothetical protein